MFTNMHFLPILTLQCDFPQIDNGQIQDRHTSRSMLVNTKEIIKSVFYRIIHWILLLNVYVDMSVFENWDCLKEWHKQWNVSQKELVNSRDENITSCFWIERPAFFFPATGPHPTFASVETAADVISVWFCKA